MLDDVWCRPGAKYGPKTTEAASVPETATTSYEESSPLLTAASSIVATSVESHEQVCISDTI